MTTTYTASWYGETYRIAADFAQASDAVLVEDADGNWPPICGGLQVADFRHDPASAMRHLLTHCAILGGDDPEENAEVHSSIESAIEDMD